MAMIKCSECGHTVSGNAKVCPECGAVINNNMEKKTNKSASVIKVLIIFVVGVLVGASAHSMLSSNQKEDKEIVANKESNDVINEEQTTTATDDEESETQEQDDAIKEVAINEPMNIAHGYGDYILTVDHVRRSDWLTRMGEQAQPGKVAVLVEMDVQNQTYEDPYNNFMFIDNQIVVLDENNYSIQSWGSGYDDGEYHMNPRIPAGTNGKIVVPYVVDETCNTLTMTFNNQYKVVAQITD